MAARPGRLPAGLGRRRGAAEARLLLLLWFAGATAEGAAGRETPLKCDELRLGQYICDDPKIDNSTQEPMNCTNHTAYVQCLPAPNITCKDHLGIEKVFTGNEVGFYKPIACRNVNGYSYKVAVALSLFLGWLGADRFYLGYPALDSIISTYFVHLFHKKIYFWKQLIRFAKVLHCRILWNW
ncbi:TM2 domain-containing protein 1 isoform X2 [Dromaius novaehollandiae]|uniref:TM2 domain-containing protein 1 isoform X2 n=1 Tax=Dromaius novaehollandiae TaxID=8790 RepID=UPI00311DBB9C